MTEEVIRGNRNVILQKYAEEKMHWTREKRGRFTQNVNKKGTFTQNLNSWDL